MTEPILRLDEITAVPGQRNALLARFDTEYVPQARERGMELTDVSGSGDALTLQWAMPDVAGFWRTRRKAMADPSVVRFWADVTPLIATRSRSWPQHPFSSVVPEGGDPPPPTSHHIVLLRSADDPPSVRLSSGATWFGAHLPGSVGGAAAASLELAMEEGSDVRLADVPNAVDVVVLGERCGGGVRDSDIRNAVKRTLLLRVASDAPPDAVAQFEADLLGMPHHITAIRNWRLSRVESSRGGWTHCWEQEYQDVSGLREDYMNHPYHWAYVDGWFDHEDPKCIVAPDVVHVFYEVPDSLLAAAAPFDL